MHAFVVTVVCAIAMQLYQEQSERLLLNSSVENLLCACM